MNALKHKKYLKETLLKSFGRLRTNGKLLVLSVVSVSKHEWNQQDKTKAVGKKACTPNLAMRSFLNPKSLLMGIAVAWGVVSMDAVTAGTIAPAPLFITSSLDPNILFILDDSGSMEWSYLPDSTSSLKGTRRGKSATVNTAYYDPTITYNPPLYADGTSLGNASFTSAWKNGYISLPAHGGTTVNLSTVFRPTWDNATDYAAAAQPAFYWQFSPPRLNCSGGIGGDVTDDDCYFQVTVGGLLDTYQNPDGTAATSAQKQQNFANWYSYYRTRLMMAKAGISRAFAKLGDTPRVGYGRINDSVADSIDGFSIDTLFKGVRPFSGTDRTDFFTWLFANTASGGTPLRRALNSAGFYYTDEGPNGPWSSTPGILGGTQLGCRQSYTVLMTDGYWNGAAAGTVAAQANNDGTAGTLITGPGGQNFTYAAINPFQDTRTNTLADVAMYYWKRDLCPTILNKTTPSTLDPAFWQHMVTYGIGLGVPTSINPTTAFNSISPPTAVAWPNPGGGGVALIDDLLHASVNGRGGFFNAKNPDTFATALTETLAKIINDNTSSAAAVAANSTQLNAGTQVYQAKFDPKDWSGRLQAFAVDLNNGALTPGWEASALLPAHGSRNIYTYDPLAAAGSRGVPFQWANLSATPLGTSQQDYLNTLTSVNDGNGALRVDWLRGDDANEKTTANPGGIFRDRTNFLGDIVNSDPVYVGDEDYGYGALPGVEGTSYTDFRADPDYTGRSPMLYVGANDGMLHGFNASSTGGQEVFAYLPNALFPELSKLTSPTYAHRYYVDGASGVGDVYDGSQWHTLLAGATGAGGRAVFALDVTNPGLFGSSSALWEFTDATDVDLGYTLAQPAVARMEDGSWAVIVANGYNSDNGHAVLFVLDALTGSVLQKIDTGIGDAANKNGLSSPIAVDTDNDRSVDTVYAGDLYGNLWKFDVSGSAGSWPVPGSPFFVACAISGPTCAAADRQPITAKPNIGKVGAAGSDQNNVGIMVYFGTGKYFETDDNSVTPQVQTFYGLWDKGTAIIDRSLLQEQTIDFEGIAPTVGGTSSTKKIRVPSKIPVCYAAISAGCTISSPLKSGWALNLLSPNNGVEGERVVSFPLLRRGFVVFSTIIPDPDPCTAGGRSFLMEVDALGGGEPAGPPFDTNGNGVVDNDDYVLIAGVQHAASGIDLEIGITKTPAVVEKPSTPSTPAVDYKYLSGSSGNMGTVTDAGGGGCVGCGGGGAGVRRSWRQLK